MSNSTKTKAERTKAKMVEAKLSKLEPLQPPVEPEASNPNRHIFNQLEAKLFEDKLLPLEGLKAYQTIEIAKRTGELS